MALESTVDEAVASEVSSARKRDSGRGVRDEQEGEAAHAEPTGPTSVQGTIEDPSAGGERVRMLFPGMRGTHGCLV
jgi:hypothetical protein